MTLDVDGFYSDDQRVKKWAKYFRDNHLNIFEFMSHADENGFYLNEKDEGFMSVDEFIDRLDEFHYKKEKIMKILACDFGKGDAAQYLANRMNVEVIAATGKVRAQIISFGTFKHTDLSVVNGEWKSFRREEGY